MPAAPHLGGAGSCPLTPWHPLPAPCPGAPGEQDVPAASISQGIREQARSSALGQGGHAVQPATHSPTLLHTHTASLHTLCVPVMCVIADRLALSSPGFQLTQKSLVRTQPYQQHQLQGLIGLARPRCTVHPSPRGVTSAREGGWASLLCRAVTTLGGQALCVTLGRSAPCPLWASVSSSVYRGDS